MLSKQEIYGESETREAQGILRFEIQLQKGKLYNLIKREGFQNVTEFLNESSRLAVELSEYYLHKFFCRGDYYRYTKAVEMIEESGFKDKTKDEMNIILKKVSKHGCLNKGLIFLRKRDYKSSKLERLLDKFDEIGLNPYTLPRRCGVKHLKNIPELVISEFYANTYSKS